jgi:DNA-binding LacI/PurR family transcriptional regulator
MTSVNRAIVILATSGASYGREIATQAIRIAREAGYRPLVAPSTPLPSPHPSVVGYMGTVFPAEVERLLASGRPVVNVSQAHGTVPFPSVFPDNCKAGRRCERRATGSSSGVRKAGSAPANPRRGKRA